VREEYHRALTLINGSPDERVLIPVLIDDAEPPGFLASRAWVDFRDASKHAEKLEELVRAIRREQPAGASDHFVNPLRGDPCPAAGSGIDEVEFLARQIARTREDVGRFRRIRRYSPAPGASVAALLWILTNGLDALDGLRSSVLAALLISMPLVTALIAWSVTHAELSACRRKLQRDHVLRDGLELCRARTGPDCRRLREKFWEIVLEQANAPASPS
jgi:hypothetical protein